jgi:hypothetical protein
LAFLQRTWLKKQMVGGAILLGVGGGGSRIGLPSIINLSDTLLAAAFGRHTTALSQGILRPQVKRMPLDLGREMGQPPVLAS